MSPPNLRKPGDLAGKLGLALALDLKGIQRPQYFVNDSILKKQIDACPKGYWKLFRYPEPARLVPRHGV